MRLLQLATGAEEIVDLHPHVTIVTGLDDRRRRLLVDTIAGLARGATPGVPGLLEAHGVLFDLTPDVLALLDVTAADLRPVVYVSDLPEGRFDPAARARVAAQRTLAVLDERVAAKAEEHARVEEARAAASAAVDRARRGMEEAEADAAGRIEAVDALTSEVDRAVEQRRRLEEERTVAVPGLEAAAAHRAEVEAATEGVRARRQELAIRCADLATQLDVARLARDPEALDVAAAANAELASLEEEIAAERGAEGARADAAGLSSEPLPARLARVQGRIEELEPRLAAFGPAEVDAVAAALASVRAIEASGPVPVPAALALADRLDELEADLVATSGVGATTGGVAEARARVDAAQRALVDAEQAVRSRVVDRSKVDQLEEVHGRLLEAIDKAESRFGGARARRQVDDLRAAENRILDEVGFSSYSDYMMGYSLRQADPQKEVALDVARADLARADDALRALEAETDAELARAERMERRRHLVEEARVLIGHPVPAGAVVSELRSLRAPGAAAAEVLEGLRVALDKAGMAVEGEDLGQDDLVLLAELLLTEASAATAREAELRAELDSLVAERAEVLAEIEAGADAPPVEDPEGPHAEPHREERLAAALDTARVALERVQAHEAAEAVVAALTQELAEAAEHERTAAEEAAAAEASVADAIAREAEVRAELDRLEDALEAAERAEAEGNEALRATRDREHPVSSEERAGDLAEAEAALAAEEARVVEGADELVALRHDREEAAAALAALEQEAPSSEPAMSGDGLSVAEEIEWYLLARLAAQRAVCVAGSLPLLLDGALAGLTEEDLAHVLGRLERMADAVQVIVISDDPLAVEWAHLTGPERAAVVHPEPSATSGATA